MNESMAWPEALRARLFEQRIVSLRGPLNDEVAGLVCAELMTLDASGDSAITLFVDSGEATLSAAFAVMDTIDLLGVPVHATCMGRADGPVVGVMAVAHRRRAARHSRFHLCAPQSLVSGRAADLERWATHHQQQLDSFVTRLSEATHRPLEHVEAEVYAGRYLSADEAVAYGLIDEIWQSDKSGSSPPDRPSVRPSVQPPDQPLLRPSVQPPGRPPDRPPLGFRPPGA
jgi:ATP-dependent Clp protease, protease subunit